MKCAKCNRPVDETGPLHRTAPLGDPEANWTCESCLKKHEPELWANISEDTDFMDLLDVLKGE